MGKNVMIDLNLLKKIIELIGYWDISKYDRAVRDDYRDIKLELDIKLRKIELRETYAKIIRAKDEDARHSARMEYLWQKKQIADACVDDLDQPHSTF